VWIDASSTGSSLLRVLLLRKRSLPTGATFIAVLSATEVNGAAPSDFARSQAPRLVSCFTVGRQLRRSAGRAGPMKPHMRFNRRPLMWRLQ
jgi:hypothetical protein